MSPIDWMDARALEESRGAQGSEALLEGLNPPQREAVTHPEGPLLIVAGAGSGKTRAITRRIGWLLSEEGVRPGEILAITFTNKAAREMRSRVEALTDARGMWICTFHAMCARILRRDVEQLVPAEEGSRWTRDFTIYDTHDKNQLLKTLIRDAGYDTTRFRPGVVGAWISDAKSRLADDGAPGSAMGGGGMEDEVLDRIFARYRRAMRENNALDFDDLLHVTLELFEQQLGVRDAYAHRFRHLLVDEYQDTNRVQYRLTRHLASQWGNVCVCGDPDQSIYAWRGADIRNILDFERDYGEDGRGVRVIKLEQNYRSSGHVLKAAQAVIANNGQRVEKGLWTEREDGERLLVRECGDENDEAAEIAARILGLRAEGTPLSSIAVFYRANFLQRALERALRLSGLPYQIVGGVEFYQRREIRDLVAYLHLLVNPTDDLACSRVINVPARGIGQKSVEKLRAWAAERGVSLLAAAGSEEARATIRGRARASLEAFSQLVANLAPLREAPAEEALERAIDETGYEAWLRDSGEEDHAARQENVDEFRAHAHTFDREQPGAGLVGFLQDVALVSDVDGLDRLDGGEGSEGGVTLMTLHAAKGLEFPVVFIAGVEEELLPHARALYEASDQELACEEERRLFYVGLTRAMERAFLTWARTRLHFGETAWRHPSRFLEELPPESVEGGGPPEADAEEEWEEAFDAPDLDPGLQEGAWVEHEHFGRGVVERLQGAGANARATVSFSNHGTKQLLLGYANLRVLADGA